MSSNKSGTMIFRDKKPKEPIQILCINCNKKEKLFNKRCRSCTLAGELNNSYFRNKGLRTDGKCCVKCGEIKVAVGRNHCKRCYSSKNETDSD